MPHGAGLCSRRLCSYSSAAHRTLIPLRPERPTPPTTCSRPALQRSTALKPCRPGLSSPSAPQLCSPALQPRSPTALPPLMPKGHELHSPCDALCHTVSQVRCGGFLTDHVCCSHRWWATSVRCRPCIWFCGEPAQPLLIGPFLKSHGRRGVVNAVHATRLTTRRQGPWRDASPPSVLT